MATTIKTKNSTTAATAPTGLAQGELAVNITDKKLYVGDAVGNSIQIAGAGATNAAGGSNTQVQYNSSGALAGSANMTFDGTSLTLGGNPTLSAGTANGVAYLNGSKVLTSGSALTYNGSTLGIKAGNGNQLVLDNAAEQYTLLEYKNNGTSKAQSYWDNTNTLFEQYIGVGSGFGFTWKASATELMRLTSTGLGIGTTSPAYKLDINPGSSGGGLQVYNPANTNTARVRVANSQSSFDMGQDGTGGYLEQIGAYPIRFYNNNAERMRIDTSGNLLVGTTNTAASNNCLVVQGNITAVNGGYTQNLYYNGGWKYAANGYGWSNYITSGAVICWWGLQAQLAHIKLRQLEH
jgi:hypothetical protein